MKLELESGTVVDDPTETDIMESIEGEGFAILGDDPMTYIQCATHAEKPGEYILEYQDGSLKRHFTAVDEPITLDRVLSAFTRYLRKDASWKSDFQWELDDLTDLE
jgi:hypothetical protein